MKKRKNEEKKKKGQKWRAQLSLPWSSETCNYNNFYKQTWDHIRQHRVYWEQLYNRLNGHLARNAEVVIQSIYINLIFPLFDK